MANKLVKVKFKAPYNGYNPNEIAGFLPHIADRIVRAGRAVLLEPEANGGSKRVRLDVPQTGGEEQRYFADMGWDELKVVYKDKFGRTPKSRATALAELPEKQ